MNPRPCQRPIQWLFVFLMGVSGSALCLAQMPESEFDIIERVVWRKVPIAVPLMVGAERLVHFPDSVSLGLPPSLHVVLRSQSINGTLYLLARQPFPPTRVLVRSETDGAVYVLDISAEAAAAEPRLLPEIEVLPPGDTAPARAEQAETSSGTHRPAARGYVALTRFAAQQLYAPTRLLPAQPGVVATPVRQQSVALVVGGAVDATPVAAWKIGGRYVTAVQLTNRSTKPVVLDPRTLRGAWLAATFQHNRLLAAGSDADTTAVYLVSDRPFEAAL